MRSFIARQGTYTCLTLEPKSLTTALSPLSLKSAKSSFELLGGEGGFQILGRTPGGTWGCPAPNSWSARQEGAGAREAGREGCEERGRTEPELSSGNDQVKAEQKSMHVPRCLSVCDLHRQSPLAPTFPERKPRLQQGAGLGRWREPPM